MASRTINRLQTEVIPETEPVNKKKDAPNKTEDASNKTKPPPKDEGVAGWSDDVASCLIFILNGIMIVFAVVAVALLAFLLYTQKSDTTQSTFSMYVPDFLLYLGIVVVVIILAISILGIVATKMQMIENKEADGDFGKDGGCKQKICSKDFCFSCGLTVYVALCIVVFLILLVLAIVAAAYSDKLQAFNAVSNLTANTDEYVNTLETELSNQVVSLADKFPITWNQTQEFMGCCAWTVNANASLAAIGYTGSLCCVGANVTQSVQIVGQAEVEFSGCRYVGSDKTSGVYTCQGFIVNAIQSNLVKISIVTFTLAILQLALGIAGSVVRWPCRKVGGKTNKVGVDSAYKTPKA